MKKLFTLILTLTLMSGCSSNSSLSSEQKAQLITDYNNKSTLKISCPSGCDVEYRDPRDKLNLPKETNGYDVANTTIRAVSSIVTTVAPWAAVGVIATEGIRNSGNEYNSSHNQDSTHDPIVTENVTNTKDVEVVESTKETVQVVDPVVVNPEVVNPVVVEPTP